MRCPRKKQRRYFKLRVDHPQKIRQEAAVALCSCFPVVQVGGIESTASAVASKFRQTGIQVRPVLSRTENVRLFGPAGHFGVQFRQPGRFERPRTLSHEEILQHRSKLSHLSPELFQCYGSAPCHGGIDEFPPWTRCNDGIKGIFSVLRPQPNGLRS